MPPARSNEFQVKPLIGDAARWFASGAMARSGTTRMSEREAIQLLEDDIERFGEPAPSRRHRQR